MSKKKCPICGAEMKIDTSVVCTSIPPKYRCVCPSCNYLDFINTSEYDQYKEQPSLPSNLDEAAEAYSENILANGEDMFDAIADGFRAGAEWMAGQGEALEVEVKEDAGGYPYIDIHIELYDYDTDAPLAKKGDKVRVQITKI